jgi:hypothetical protein
MMNKKTTVFKIILLVLCMLQIMNCATENNVTAEKTEINTEETITDFGRHYIDLFYNGRLEELFAVFSDSMKEGLPMESLTSFHEDILTYIGLEKELESEEVIFENGIYYYSRIYNALKYSEKMLAQLAIDESGIIYSIYINVLPVVADNPNLDYITKTNLVLPFESEWYVIWGGRTLEQNYHAAYMDQRFVYDFLIVKNGSSYKNDGKNNEDYYCFGMELYAPADGVIHTVENNVHDNVPGVMNNEYPPGNFIVIDHENGEYSIMAHFKQSSIVVKPGDTVKQGQFLGLCGNSGNSSEPHLHFHMQDTPIFGNGIGIPAFFNNYFADGLPVEKGEPVQGQIIKK